MNIGNVERSLLPRYTSISATLTTISRELATLLEPKGFIRGMDHVCRRWNLEQRICCAVAAKKFDSTGFFTIEVGFVSPQILEWCGLVESDFPLPYEGNGYGIFFRPEDLEITDGFMFPPGGWRFSTDEEHTRFSGLLKNQLGPKLASLLDGLLTWDGWIQYVQQEIRRFPRGRGRAWSLLGYAMLASPNKSILEIEAVLDEHARQDGSRKMNNRVEASITHQRDLLRKTLMASK